MTNFRNLNDYDDVGEIATWIYNTDEFTFNLLFYNDKVRAITAIERLIMSDYINPYHRNFITILYDENQGILKELLYHSRVLIYLLEIHIKLYMILHVLVYL